MLLWLLRCPGAGRRQGADILAYFPQGTHWWPLKYCSKSQPPFPHSISRTAQVDASEETRLRTFALEDRLVAIETAIANLHAVLVPGDKGQAVSNANAERKVCSSL